MELDLHMQLGLTPAALEAAIMRGQERAVVEIAELLREHAVARFDSATGPDGTPWDPLDPDTKSPTGQIGVRTGTLRGSITATPTSPTEGVRRAEVHVGAWYAGFFQGARPIIPVVWDRAFTRSGRRSRRRRVESVSLPDDVLARISAIVTRHVDASIEGARREAESRPTEV